MVEKTDFKFMPYSYILPVVHCIKLLLVLFFGVIFYNRSTVVDRCLFFVIK